MTRFQTQKTAALLAYLALYPNRSHPREVVAELLWPGDDPHAIRNRLNQAVSSLRRQLHGPGMEKDSILKADHHAVELNSLAVTTDVQQFRQELKKASLTQDPAVKHKHLLAAVQLYTGDLLEGSYEDWVLTERAFLREKYIDALDSLIRLSVELKDLPTAILAAECRVEADPEDERAHLALMRVLLRMDKPRAAIRQFEVLETRLATFEETPSEAAYALLERAEQQAHRPPDTQSAEFEAAAPFASEFEELAEPTRTIVVGPRLPRFFTPFFGRRELKARIEKRLSSQADRLITLTGFGGCGKSRLSIEVGWDLVDTFQGHVYFVPFHVTPTVDGAYETIVHAVVGPRAPYDDPLLALKLHLTGAERVLFIFDNLEHLVDSGLPQIDDLFEALPNLQILATSRRAIGRGDERIIALEPLEVPRSEPLPLAEMAQISSVALFVARAQSAKQDFQLTPRNAAAISELCRQLEGIPLAIELAASWARSMAPAQMVEEFAKRLDLLAARRQDIPERHRSMRAAIDSSVALLPVELRETFFRLSVFHNGWSLEAAHQLCPDVEIRTAMAQLEERSLIRTLEDPLGVRFYMFLMLRAYAQDHLSADAATECGWLHAHYYRNEVARLADGPAPGYEARFDREAANIVAALEWFESHGDTESVLHMALNLCTYWTHRGEIQAALHRLRSAISKCPHAPEPWRIAARARIALLRLLAGEVKVADAELEAASKQLDPEAQRNLLIEVVIAMAHVRHMEGRYDEARAILERARDMAIAADNPRYAAIAWRRLGNTSIERRQWTQAMSEYMHGLRIAREADLRAEIAHTLLNLGFLAGLMDKRDGAREWLHEAVQISRESGSAYGLIDATLVLASLDRIEGNFSACRAKLVDVTNVNPQIWNLRRDTVREAAFLFLASGHMELAAKTFGLLESLQETQTMLDHGIFADVFGTHHQRLTDCLGEKRFEELRMVGRAMAYEAFRAQLQDLDLTPQVLAESLA